MRVVLEKNNLLHSLQIVSRAVPSRTTKPILYGIRFVAEQSQLTLCAYDLEIGIENTMTYDPETNPPILQIEEPGSIVLHARYLIDIVRKLPHHLVRIDVQDLTTTIRSGNATYTLNGMDPREYPQLPQVDDQTGLSVASDALMKLIDHTAFSVAVSESRPTLTGVLWTYREGLLVFTATDSHRLSTQTLQVGVPKGYEDVDAIIPGKSLLELARILPDSDAVCDLYLADNQLLVRFENTRLYSRLIDGKYPDVSRIIPTTWRTAITVEPKSFTDCIERAALLARDNDNQVIRMNLRRTHIEISSHSPEIGKITETMEPNTFEGEDMLIGCNSKFLMDALKASSDSLVRIEFSGPGSAFMLKSIQDERHLHLILPVRVVNN
ncbi:MAG: DNA polymerase III subunit beta [Bacilli bacterium]